MAYVITAVGAGGKTTYLSNRAKEYLRQGKTAAVTTTTHIWPPKGGLSSFHHQEQIDRSNYIDIWYGSEDEPDYYGTIKLQDGSLPGEKQGVDADTADRRGTDGCMAEKQGMDAGTAKKQGVNAGTAEKQGVDAGTAGKQGSTGSGKLSALPSEQFEALCRKYDVVLVEGDGSHCMPVKIPGENEPIIPECTDEIVVVMGAHAIGRRLDVVCHRYRRSLMEKLTKADQAEADQAKADQAEADQAKADQAKADQAKADQAEADQAEADQANADHAEADQAEAIRWERSAEASQADVIPAGTPEEKRLPEMVTEEMLEEIAEQYYMSPLKQRYPRAKITYVLSRMPHALGKIKAVLMASGFGRRYGGNKLVDLYNGRPLYRHALEHVAEALGKENVVVVTQYRQIYDEVRAAGIDAVMNHEAKEGIAASIRIGTRKAQEAGADAVIFFAADMPDLPSSEISLYAEQFMDSGKPFGCMVFGPKHICTNPGAFRLDTGAERLLSLTGDRGAMRIMKQEPWNIYYYQIAPECAADVDLLSDVSLLPEVQTRISSHRTALWSRSSARE